MTASNKKKTVRYYHSTGVTAKKLRELADGLENGRVSVDGKIHRIPQKTNVKVTMRSKGGRLDIKLKIKTEETEKDPVNKVLTAKRPPTAMAKEKTSSSGPPADNFKTLKKRLSRDFGAIMKAMAKPGSFPEKERVEKFYADAKAMYHFPEAAGMDFTPFLDQLESFYQSFKLSDRPAVETGLSSLNRLKKECHRNYK